jgi:hypothetical protein
MNCGSLFELWREIANVPLRLSGTLPVTWAKQQPPAEIINTSAARRADVFLRENHLRHEDLRCDRTIKTYGHYQPGSKTAYQETLIKDIEYAQYLNEIADMDASVAIASQVKSAAHDTDTPFAHRCVLRCDCIIQAAGQPITMADPEKWLGRSRDITKGCIATNEWPAAIAAIGSEAVTYRDRAFLEPKRFDGHLKSALKLIGAMQDLLVSKCYGRKYSRNLLRHLEFERLFLKVRFLVDLEEDVSGDDIRRFKALCRELNQPRLLLDMLRGLAIYHMSRHELDAAAEFLTPAIWMYEHDPTRRSPYTFFSLLKSVCHWSENAGRLLPVEFASELFADQYADYAQSAIKARFARFIPGFRSWPRRKEWKLLNTPRFATRTSNLPNHPELLEL